MGFPASFIFMTVPLLPVPYVIHESGSYNGSFGEQVHRNRTRRVRFPNAPNNRNTS